MHWNKYKQASIGLEICEVLRILSNKTILNKWWNQNGRVQIINSYHAAIGRTLK